MRISDWSSDVCSSDLKGAVRGQQWVALGVFAIDHQIAAAAERHAAHHMATELRSSTRHRSIICVRLPPFKRIIDDEVHDPCHGVRAIDRCSAAGEHIDALEQGSRDRVDIDRIAEAERNGARSVDQSERSEEHTSELQSLMRISYAVFCLKKKK